MMSNDNLQLPQKRCLLACLTVEFLNTSSGKPGKKVSHVDDGMY